MMKKLFEKYIKMISFSKAKVDSPPEESLYEKAKRLYGEEE